MGEKQPVFSIGVPAYERPIQLAACLQALARLDYSRERFEVIVVDDGSQQPKILLPATDESTSGVLF